MRGETNRQLIAAEHGGRILVERLAPRNSSVWEVDAVDTAGGRALMAAARWAALMGATVRVTLGGEFAGEAGAALAESCRRQGLAAPGVADGARLAVDGGAVTTCFDDTALAWKVAPKTRALFVRSAIGESAALTCAQCRDIDRKAIAEYSVPGICLMENAAIASVAVATDMLPALVSMPVAVVVGGGNNGGDGLAVARGLHALDIPVEVALLKPAERLIGDAAINLGLLRDHPGIPVHPIHDEPARLSELLTGKSLIIDALLGTGFKGELAPAFRQAIEIINAAEAATLALDLPSGLDGDTGEAVETAVRAAATITFAAMKTGLARRDGPAFSGEVFLGNIGAPQGAFPVSS